MNDHIHIRNVTKTFAEFTLSCDLTIAEHEMVSLLGPSGCGKSTTLSLINGILTPNEGSIILGGRDMTPLPIWERPIGYVFQDYALFPHMNVRQNIAYSLKIAGRPKAERDRRVDELLEIIQLEGYGNRTIEHLSGGEKQRVALARAIAPKPKLLLLDEPLSALDAKLRISMRKEIQRIHREMGLTTLYVTHDQEEALAISDRIAVMNAGRIEQTGTPEEIYQQPATLFAANFIGLSNIIPSDEIRFPTECPHIVFRPEHVDISQTTNETTRQDAVVFSRAHLIYEEYAGQHYVETFSWNGREITAYSKKKRIIDTMFELSVAKNHIICLR
ncbi:MAG: ABC transporter ATP-binding protein [Spirochaetota bacterium]